MKRKVLFILHTPPPLHGAATVGKYICESSLINSEFECKYLRLGTTTSFKERRKITARKFLRFIKLVIRAFFTSLSFRPDLVYLSITSKGMGFYKDALVVLALKLTGSKLLFHFHNKGIRTRQHIKFDDLIYNFVFRKANVILLSKHIYHDIKKYVPASRVYYCPNGIPDTINKSQNTKQKENKEPLEILFLSNLIESKGVFVLFEACKILKQKGLTYHCTYVGDAGDVNAQQFHDKVNELELTAQIEYVGKKYGEEKEEVFSNADIFVHPTFEDCFPLILLEAMQHKLPVVSTFEGGIPDIVEDGRTGFLVPQKDAVALAEKLEILIQNPTLRQKMGNAGRKKYEEEFTINKFEKNLLKIIRDNINA